MLFHLIKGYGVRIYALQLKIRRPDEADSRPHKGIRIEIGEGLF